MGGNIYFRGLKISSLIGQINQEVCGFVCVTLINKQYFKIHFSQKFVFPASLEKSTILAHISTWQNNYGGIAAVSLYGAHVLQFTKILSWLGFSSLCNLPRSEGIWISNP